MKTYIALLRGINVSGKNIIKMVQLKQMFEDIGFTDVITYIQSGNIIFSSDETNESILESTISEAIIKTFGFEVPVMVLLPNELNIILKANPFITEDNTKLHITLLSKNFDSELIANIDLSKYLPDRCFIIERAVYLFCPNGYGNTKLTNTFFEKKLECTATTRNLKTWMELLKLCS